MVNEPKQEKDPCRKLLLNNHEVIRIIRSGSNAEKAALHNCFPVLFKMLFITLVFKTGGQVMTGSKEALFAEEAFNDMLVDFYEQVMAGQFDPEGASLPVYLYIIFYRKYWKFKEKDKRLKTLNVEDPGKYDAAGSKYHGDLPGGELQILERSIAKCGEPCKQVLSLTYVDGLNVDQVAAELNLAEQTVKNRLSKCSRNLKEIIKNQTY